MQNGNSANSMIALKELLVVLLCNRDRIFDRHGFGQTPDLSRLQYDFGHEPG